MAKKERRPGDPYEVGFGKPPKRTRFKKGRSGNPFGRPRKKPDVYSELTKVLREKVTIAVDGQPEKVTVQQALLLRLALPDRVSEYEDIERRLTTFRIRALMLQLDKLAQIESDAAANSVETTNAE
jgi:hypothetical protein